MPSTASCPPANGNGRRTPKLGWPCSLRPSPAATAAPASQRSSPRARPGTAASGQAYTRYGNGAARALDRDFDHALHWLCTNVLKYRHPQHEKKNSQGGKGLTGPRGPSQLRSWLANAMAWADYEFAGKRYRWTVHAVLQTLAWHAYTAGEQKNGTWVVAVGGRSLSLATGLLSEDAVWRVLRDLRDRPGAPLIRTRTHPVQRPTPTR